MEAEAGAAVARVAEAEAKAAEAVVTAGRHGDLRSMHTAVRGH